MKRWFLVFVALALAGCGGHINGGISRAQVRAAESQCQGWAEVQGTAGDSGTPFYTEANLATCMHSARESGKVDAYTRKLMQDGPPADMGFPTG